MRAGFRITLAFVSIAAAVAETGQDYAASVNKYRADRETRLKADNGWLTVAGLHWLKEGDSSTFLYLVPTGLSDPEEPTWGAWPGRYGLREDGAGRPYYWANQVDAWQGTTNRDNTLRRWAVALQNGRMVLEAESFRGKEAAVFVDARASGKKCAVVKLAICSVARAFSWPVVNAGMSRVSMATIWSPSLIMGFLNFNLSLALALFAFSFWIRWADKKWRDFLSTWVNYNRGIGQMREWFQKGLALRGAITNLFDNKPPTDLQTYGGTGSNSMRPCASLAAWLKTAAAS